LVRRADSDDSRRGRRRRRVASVVVFVVTCARSVVAQEPLFDRLGFDKLQLVSLGAAVGRILPSQVEPAMLFAMSADYGEIARSWRVVFGVSYWESRYRDAVVQTFVDTLNQNREPGAIGRVQVSRVSLYDVTFSAEARYVPTYSGELKPYLGIGLAAHVIDAEGKLVNGTFIERSLDNIAAGVFLTAGVSVRLVSHFGIEGSARADLLSGFRSTQVRAGGSYYFGHVRGTTTSSRSGTGANTNRP
jgi:hypothetical protein